MENKSSKKGLTVVVLIWVALLGLILAAVWMNKDRIVLAPQIEAKTQYQTQEVTVALLVKEATSGSYVRTCRYDLSGDGSTKLIARNYWKSYDDTISDKTYRKLKKLVPDLQPMQVWHTPHSLVTVFWKEHGQMRTILEMDEEGNELFRFEFDPKEYSSPAQVVLTGEEAMHVLSYQKSDGRLYVTTVDRADSSQHTVSFSYAELSGEADSGLRMGNFVPDGDRACVRDGVLYMADTYYHDNSGAVIAAWDLAAGRPLSFERIEGTQVMDVWWREDSFTVLLNHKNLTPLELRTYDLHTMQPTGSVEMQLPPEFSDGPNVPQDYFLFKASSTPDYVGVLFPDTQRAAAKDGNCYRVMTIYDRDTGEMVSRVTLALDEQYDIYDFFLTRKKTPDE